MQQSHAPLFCSECGAANEPAALSCVACQSILTHEEFEPSGSALRPVPVKTAAVREVTAGASVPLIAQSADFWPGMLLFGHYRIRQEIGRGGFSVVYLAEDLRAANKLVAIKRIYLSTLTSRQMIDATQTYHREISILPRLKHVDGVPKFYESFIDKENWYLAMEYIQGQTLEEYMQRASGGYLPESEVIDIGQKLAAILEKLHMMSIIFRDVKPSNIMITPTNDLYLIDFGIARIFTSTQKKDTVPLGSPGYAAPEQYGRAQTRACTDVYGLGATLQTLLMGREPLELAQGEPPRNPQQPSPRIQKLLDEMLVPEMKQRLSSMNQVKARLIQPDLLTPWKSWRAFFSICAGIGFGILIYILAYFLIYNDDSGFLLPLFLLVLIIPGIGSLMASSEGRTLPWQKPVERFWRKNRYIDRSFLLLGLVGVWAIVFIGWAIHLIWPIWLIFHHL